MARPRVRAVVLNYNGGEHVLRCLDHLLRTDWPSEALEVVVVDNDSSDGSNVEIGECYPEVRMIPAGANRGFPGNNLALRDLEGIDYVALVNNDAFVDEGWLAPLVDTLEADPGIGAVCPRILFEPGFVDVTISSRAFRPAGGDTRELGVQVRGVEVAGADAWRRTQFHKGFWGLEHLPDGSLFQWTDERATLRLPVEAGRPAAGEARLLLAGRDGSGETPVTVQSGPNRLEVRVGAEPVWVDVPLSGEPYDVVNNVGSVIIEGGFGADRGFLEPDVGQFDRPIDVFNWCGAGVLFPVRYLQDAGLFDERFFMYYEDTDLSWRARAQGWRHRYVPDSTIRHLHAATSVEGSALFTHFVERNRLLLLWKNAPIGLALRAAARHLLSTSSYARRDILRPMLHGHRPNSTLTRRRVRAFAGFLRLLPAMTRDRRGLRRRQVVDDAELLAWMVAQP